jgi:DNA-binding transcriptional LysR family regulator
LGLVFGLAAMQRFQSGCRLWGAGHRFRGEVAWLSSIGVWKEKRQYFLLPLSMPCGYALHAMELRHLRYFVEVARQESVTKAAAQLHVSQPALSRQIRDLEEELGVGLFEHHARSVKLTAAGHVFYEEAQMALQRVHEAVETVKRFAGAQTGELQVGYAPSLSMEILPQALRRFQMKCPNVKMQLQDLTTEEMIVQLRSGTLHAALLVRPAAGSLASGLEYREIVRHRPCVAMSVTHELAGHGPISASTLAGKNLLVYSREHYPEHHSWIESVLKGVSPRPRIVGEYDSSTSLVAAIDSGCGVALVHDGFNAMSGFRLCLRSIDDGTHDFSFGVAWRRDEPSPFTRRFVEAVVGLDAQGTMKQDQPAKT